MAAAGDPDGRPIAALPSALAEAPRLCTALSGRALLLFLDYDGTLSPIVRDPGRALLPTATRATVERLAKRCPVAIVSGRDLGILRGFVGLDTVWYAASHGFEISGPRDRPVEHQVGRELLPLLEQAGGALAAALAEVPGLRLERKRFAIAVHYREVPDRLVPEVQRVVAEIAARRPGLRIDGGKKIFEVKPDLDWHKGRAVEWLLGAMGREGPRDLPIYIGDDITDEDAFRTLRRLGRGIGIAVAGGSHATAAEWMLPDTDAVRHFLQVLEQELHRAGD